jgi:DNA-binding transcriptional MerR regulator
LGQTLYRIGQFAQKASVSVRTLQFYDKMELLSPSRYTEAGYRMYTEDDLIKLETILALKFLGFTLAEIKKYLEAGPQSVREALRQQKAMLTEKRDQLNLIIDAISETEEKLSSGQCDWEAIRHVIQVMQMEQKKDWVDKYFTPEQRIMLKELSKKSYSEEALKSLQERDEWTEEDQKRVDEQYASDSIKSLFYPEN